MLFKCSCPITEGMNYDELTQIIRDRKMCTDRLCICPNLDRELRRADVERQRRQYYNKRLERAGYSKDQIAEMPRGRRTAGRSFEVAEVDFDF